MGDLDRIQIILDGTGRYEYLEVRLFILIMFVCTELMVLHIFMNESYYGEFCGSISITENGGNIKGQFFLCLN